MTKERLIGSRFDVDVLPTLDDIDDRHGLARFLSRAPRGDLADLANEFATLLSTVQTETAPRRKGLPEILIVGWRDLRAPPSTPPL
jgi:hypothetical protein